MLLAKDPVSCTFLMMVDGPFSFLWWQFFFSFSGNNITTFLYSITKAPNTHTYCIWYDFRSSHATHSLHHWSFSPMASLLHNTQTHTHFGSFSFTFLFIFCIFYNHVTMAIHFVHMFCPCSSLCIYVSLSLALSLFLPLNLFVILSLFLLDYCAFFQRFDCIHIFFQHGQSFMLTMGISIYIYYSVCRNIPKCKPNTHCTHTYVVWSHGRACVYVCECLFACWTI